MGEVKNPLSEKSYSFALLIIELYKDLINLKKEYILSKQLLRSGTSIGANIGEANGAISNADFSAKISIAYKESLEVEYWLSLLKDSKYLEIETFQNAFEKQMNYPKSVFNFENY